MNNGYEYLMYTLKNNIHPKEAEIILPHGFKFKFKRTDNTLRFKDDCSNDDFFITVEIFNNVGGKVYEFRMSESDSMRLIENISIFLYEFDYTGSTMYIGLAQENNHFGIYPVIYLEKTGRIYEDDLSGIYYDKDSDQSRYIDMYIINHRADIDKDEDLIKIPLSGTELEEFIFEITMLLDAELKYPDNFEIPYF